MLYFVTVITLIALTAFRSAPPRIYQLVIPDMRQSSKYVLPSKLFWKNATTLTVSFADRLRNDDVRIFEYVVSYTKGFSSTPAVISHTFDISYTQYVHSIKLPSNLTDRKELQGASLIADATGKNLLIETVVKDKPQGPQINREERNLPNNQIWLAQLPKGNGLRPLFYSKGAYHYTWASRAKYIIVSSYCYGGDLASGLYAIELSNLNVVSLKAHYDGGCEGENGFEVSPNEQFIFISGQPMDMIASMDSRWRMTACADGVYARSVSWSDDGRYLFLACNGKQSDRLERFDTVNKARTILIKGIEMPFRATSMSVSPDLKRIAFQYGISTYGINDTNGIWVIDFT